MEEKQGFFKRLKKGLTKTRDSFVSGVDSLFHGYSDRKLILHKQKSKGL